MVVCLVPQGCLTGLDRVMQLVLPIIGYYDSIHCVGYIYIYIYIAIHAISTHCVLREWYCVSAVSIVSRYTDGVCRQYNVTVY